MFEEVRKWFEELAIERAAKALRANGFEAHTVPDKNSAKELVLSLIPPGSTVGVGGSVTIRELGLIEELEKRGYEVYHHWIKAPPEEIQRLRRLELTSDVFLCSSNAVTMDGKLVSIDDYGNRVAAMIFGPKRVIVVAGKNKLVRDVDEGIWRARNVAAVMNAKRLEQENPCAKLGYCVDCKSPTRACKVLVVLERRPPSTDIHVVLVNERLGF